MKIPTLQALVFTTVAEVLFQEFIKTAKKLIVFSLAIYTDYEGMKSPLGAKLSAQGIQHPRTKFDFASSIFYLQEIAMTVFLVIKLALSSAGAVYCLAQVVAGLSAHAKAGY